MPRLHDVSFIYFQANTNLNFVRVYNLTTAPNGVVSWGNAFGSYFPFCQLKDAGAFRMQEPEYYPFDPVYCPAANAIMNRTVISEGMRDLCDNSIPYSYCGNLSCSDSIEQYEACYLDECASEPCENGGSCVDMELSFHCQCVAGYSGVQCETDIDECSSVPCQHAATCHDALNSFTCHCAAGFSGTLCETDVDECASAPCQHEGTCLDRPNSFECRCPSYATGLFPPSYSPSSIFVLTVLLVELQPLFSSTQFPPQHSSVPS